MKIPDEQQLEELLTRSVDTIYPSKEGLKKEIQSGRQLTIYMGIDPTADYIHLGHSTNYLILQRFHKLGHKIIALVGDFTASIGDPTDKEAERVRLTREQIEKNLKTFKGQIGKILDFNNKENPIEFRFNSEWLKKLNFEDVINLTSNFTVQQMIERDMFEKRLENKKPLYIHEFFYPMMQGYDSVELEPDVEVGGTDQTFNMLAGRSLLKSYKNKNKFVITTTLLENPKTGEKLMSKSLGTGVSLNSGSNEMYGGVMALPDEGVVQCFIDCTNIPLDEVKTLEGDIKNNPLEIKKRLAYEITKLYHGEEEAQKAEKYFVSVFSKKEIPENPDIKLKATKGEELTEILVRGGFISSKSEYRRKRDEGAVFVDGVKIISDLSIEKDSIIKIGKRVGKIIIP